MINKIGAFLRFYTRVACGDNFSLPDTPASKLPVVHFSKDVAISLDTLAAILPVTYSFSEDVATLSLDLILCTIELWLVFLAYLAYLGHGLHVLTRQCKLSRPRAFRPVPS